MVTRINTKRPARLIFTSDFHELQRGNFMPGSQCTIAYDPVRIVGATKVALIDKASAYVGNAVKQNIQEVTLHFPMGRVSHPDIDITGHGTTMQGAVKIPESVDEIVVWFSCQLYGGTVLWDSDYGANFHFRFPRLDLRFDKADVENGNAKSLFTVEISAVDVIDPVNVRFRILNQGDSFTERIMNLQKTLPAAGSSLWRGATELPPGPNIAFDVLYFVNGRRYKDDNDGHYYLVPETDPVLNKLRATRTVS